MAIAYLFTISLITEIVAFICSIIFLRNCRERYWHFFTLYLALVIVVEILGGYLHAIGSYNYPVYNLLMIVQSWFFAFLFYKTFQQNKTRIRIMAASIFFLLFFIAEAILTAYNKQNMMLVNNYNGYSRMLLSVLITLACCIYFFTIIKEDIIRNPLHSPNFWVIIGLFFFYFGSLPMFAFIKIISKIKLSGNVSFYTLVMNTLCFVLYGSWIIAFICQKKQRS